MAKKSKNFENDRNKVLSKSNLKNIKNLFMVKTSKNFENDIKLKKIQRHPFHLVDYSASPFVVSISALTTTTSAVMYMQHFQFSGYFLIFGVFMLIITSFIWWRDIIRESTFQGHHTKIVQKGLRLGLILFIISEVMFFFGFFWVFFSVCLSPAIEIGGVWPPIGIAILNPWQIPLLNTLILLLSGATCTLAHHSIICGNRKNALFGLVLTIILGTIFTGFQILEYYEANFTISDSIYGSIFFMATGFHGFHVLIGSLFLLVCFIRLIKHHFTREHHFNFEAAAMYWHFVDVVWLVLFVSIYWWGGF